ncbi:MAG: hypothetical protein ACI88L_000330 [Candidatus Paceibacteria bacterium]|jgi:hypothetical protein
MNRQKQASRKRNKERHAHIGINKARYRGNGKRLNVIRCMLKWTVSNPTAPIFPISMHQMHGMRA